MRAAGGRPALKGDLDAGDVRDVGQAPVDGIERGAASPASAIADGTAGKPRCMQRTAVPEDDDRAVEQRETVEGADPGDERERRAEQREQADEGVLRDSDQGVGGQFE